VRSCSRLPCDPCGPPRTSHHRRLFAFEPCRGIVGRNLKTQTASDFEQAPWHSAPTLSIPPPSPFRGCNAPPFSVTSGLTLRIRFFEVCGTNDKLARRALWRRAWAVPPKDCDPAGEGNAHGQASRRDATFKAPNRFSVRANTVRPASAAFGCRGRASAKTSCEYAKCKCRDGEPRNAWRLGDERLITKKGIAH